MEFPWHLYLMGSAYGLAGIAHWLFPKVYRRILPPWVPFPGFTIWFTGLLETVLGVAVLFEGTREYALWGIIAMLAAFLPVHIHMLRDARAGKGIPRWLLWLRLPVQGLLVFWAAAYL